MHSIYKLEGNRIQTDSLKPTQCVLQIIHTEKTDRLANQSLMKDGTLTTQASMDAEPTPEIYPAGHATQVFSFS